MTSAGSGYRAAGMALVLGLGVGCRQEMADRGRLKPLAESQVFADGQAARPLVPGTRPRGGIPPESPLATGVLAGHEVDTLPQPLTSDLLARGQTCFGVACSPCHGLLGDADGLVVQRGFLAPPSFHEVRLRAVPLGHLVHVIATGYGAMYPYANRVAPLDRWAIAAYIRALQLSRQAPVSALSAADRARLGPVP